MILFGSQMNCAREGEGKTLESGEMRDILVWRVHVLMLMCACSPQPSNTERKKNSRREVRIKGVAQTVEAFGAILRGVPWLSPSSAMRH